MQKNRERNGLPENHNRAAGLESIAVVAVKIVSCGNHSAMFLASDGDQP